MNLPSDKTLRVYKQLGATKTQIILGVVIQLSILGLIATVLGSMLGMWVMTLIPDLKNINVGGIIIKPKMDFWLLLVIVFSNFMVVITKASQKVNQLYS